MICGLWFVSSGRPRNGDLYCVPATVGWISDRGVALCYSLETLFDVFQRGKGHFRTNPRPLRQVSLASRCLCLPGVFSFAFEIYG